MRIYFDKIARYIFQIFYTSRKCKKSIFYPFNIVKGEDYARVHLYIETEKHHLLHVCSTLFHKLNIIILRNGDDNLSCNEKQWQNCAYLELMCVIVLLLFARGALPCFRMQLCYRRDTRGISREINYVFRKIDFRYIHG